MAHAAPPKGAVGHAVEDLGGEHDAATQAVYALQQGGRPAAVAIRDAWPSLSELAQKRAIVALRTLAQEHDEAVQALVLAARSEDEEVRRRGLDALRGNPKRGRAGLAALLNDPRSGDRAAALLARTEPDYAVGALLTAMSETGGSERSGLRDALGVAVLRAETPERAIRVWLREDPTSASAASAALGLSGTAENAKLVRDLTRHAMRDADDFSTAWRLLRSAPGAGPDPSIDAWVDAHLTTPPEWMLRAAAVEATAARGRRGEARASLADPYPRVRLAAATALAGDSASMIERATLARKDTWPMVRASAVTSLADESDALPILIAAVSDSMSVVRVAAIEALTPLPHDEGWEPIHGRLRAANEWPKVTAAAIGYVVAHCRADAAESLFRVVLRAAPSHALTDDLNNAALAIEALRVLGTPEADAVIQRLRATPEVPPTLKMALDQPLSDDARCAAARP